MGISSDGQICYGIALEEGTELPWEEHGDIEGWWMEVNGYSGKQYPEEGYYEEQKQWLKENPCPVEVTMHCSYDYPMYIISKAGTEIRAWRGDPKPLDLDHLLLNQGNGKELIEFCEKYEIEIGDETPKWWLSSLYG